MKTKEELNALKEEVETVNRKLHELTDEELAQVSGGFGVPTVEPTVEPDDEATSFIEPSEGSGACFY